MSIVQSAVLYIAVFLFTTCLGFFSQKVQQHKIIFRPQYLAIAYFIHTYVTCFTNIGADYDSYCQIVERQTFKVAISDVEIGFNLICLFFKSVFHSSDICVFFIKLITISIFYYGFYLLRNDAVIGLSIFAYNAILFVRSFYLLSMNLNIAFLFISFIYLTRQNNKKAIIFLIIACSIHLSSFLFIPIYLLYYALSIKKKKMRTLSILFVSSCSLFILIFYSQIYSLATSRLSLFQHYSSSDYGNVIEKSGIGIMQYVFFSFVFYFVYLIYNNIKNVAVKNSSIVFSITAFVFALLGYKLGVLARINNSFFGIYSVLVPVFFMLRKNKRLNTDVALEMINLKAAPNYEMDKKGKCIFDRKIDLFIWCFYLILLWLLTFTAVMKESDTSRICHYVHYNPFI